MNSTSHWLLAVDHNSSKPREGLARWTWARNFSFALFYAAGVFLSFSVVYPGTPVAVFWPPVGIAVWWAVTCQSWRMYGFICGFVFILPAAYVGIFSTSSLVPVLLYGLSHVIAGPGIGLLMIVAERIWPSEYDDAENGKLFAPYARIRLAVHVYRLLIFAVIAVMIAKFPVLLGFAIDGEPASLELYSTLVLRDIAGIVLVAGPGIAISSSIVNRLTANMKLEFGAAILVTTLVLILIFGFTQNIPIVYLAMLPLYWSATRLPVPLASLHAAFTASAAILLAYFVNAEPFAGSDNSAVAQATSIQLFIIMSVVLSLVVSTTVQHHSALAEELAVLTKTLPDALLIRSRSGRIFPMNDLAYEHLETNEDGGIVLRQMRDMRGDPIEDEDRPSSRALRGETVDSVKVEMVREVEDGLPQPKRVFSLSAAPMYLDGETEPGHALLLFHDSTNEYRMVQQLQMAYEEAYLLFEHAPQGVVILDQKGHIIQANHAFGELIGKHPDLVMDRKLDEFTVESGLIDEVGTALKQPGDLAHTDRSFTTTDGEKKNVALSFRAMRSENDPSGRLLVNLVDVTERQRLHELVTHFADHDSLTGLLNRRRFESDFEDILCASGREDRDGALMMLDLDNFKTVNDVLGHHVGDELLIEFSEVLTENVRETDVVGRLGGDEFVIALPNTDLAEATAISERIIRAVNQRFRYRPNETARVTASIGITMFSEARERGMDPFLLADRLLYDAKHKGRNRVATDQPRDQKEESTPRHLSREFLRSTLESDALRLEFQPILDIATGEIVSAEALLRVDEDAASVTTPEFVGAIERAGLAPQLDIQILRKGIASVQKFRGVTPDFRLCLNVSAQSVCSEEVRRAFASELQERAVEPGALILEITETAPLVDVHAAQHFQHTMNEFGVEFSLDDFGVGHDPYRYLKQLDFRTIKIAGEFVEGMVQTDVDDHIVESIVSLAHGQELNTVAEYVSSADILEAVRAKGVSYAQGFHIGKSVSLEDFVRTHLVPN